MFFALKSILSDIQFSSVAQSCPTLCDPMEQPSLSINSRSSLKLMFIESVMSSNHLILRHPLLLLPSIFPSIKVFSNELGLFQRAGSLHQVVKILELLLQHQSSNEYSGLISYRIDWFDFLAVQGTFNSLLQHHNSKALIL